MLFLILLTTQLILTAVSDPKREVELVRFQVNTTISFRYSKTEVTAKYKNPGSEAGKAVFNMVLPKSAFISNFSMIIKDEEYVAEVKEKEEAKKTYDSAVASGDTAGLVSKNKRDSNHFSVDTNLEPGEKVVFTLTYEELLERQDDQYEYVLHIDPGEVLDDFYVEVNINESLPLSKLSVPELLESNELDFSQEERQSSTAQVTREVGGSPHNARVVFSPSKEEQLEAGDQGVSGRFVVRYDVDREGQDSEVQVIDGYFVHYFVPADLPTLPKHAVFVLDTSGSMGGEKIQQLKDAMFTVLEDLTESDYFNIIEFNFEIKHWNGEGFSETNTEFYRATETNKENAIRSVLDLSAGGGTNLNDAIIGGLDVVKDALEREALPKEVKSMVVFLTDGLPSSGTTDHDTIRSNIRRDNRDLQIPVFTIAFGADTDIDLLQSIASQNHAISKRIYEGSDAALQLEDFYSQISSPLLSDLKFEYVGGLDNSSISRTAVNTFFKSGEFIVTGRLSEVDGKGQNINVSISGFGKDGLYDREFVVCIGFPCIQPSKPCDGFPESRRCSQPLLAKPSVFPKSEAQGFLQKLFAFQHIKQLIRREAAAQTQEERDQLKEKATELSLQNNFVTDLTSLVVVKPDEEPKVTDYVDNIRPVSAPYFSSRLTSSLSLGINQNSFSRIVGGPSGLRGGAGKIVGLHGHPGFGGLGGPFGGFPTTPRIASTTTGISRTSTTTRTSSKTTTTSPDCKLRLYSRTYHRGDHLDLTDSSPDLAGFAKTAVTAKLTGECCWQLYSQTDYMGDLLTLRPGQTYTSVTSLGNLFRNVVSVSKVTC